MSKEMDNNKPPATAKPRGPVKIKLNRDAQCGEKKLEAGDIIAEVILRNGAELNYVVDALRGGIASELVVETKPETTK